MTRAAIARMPAASSAGRTAAVFSARRTGQAVAQFFFTAPDHGPISYDHHDTGQISNSGMSSPWRAGASRERIRWHGCRPRPIMGLCAFWLPGIAVTWAARSGLIWSDWAMMLSALTESTAMIS